MFRSAIIKLTIAYLSFVMILSIGFSLMLYKISDSELSNGLRRPQHNVFRETSIYDFNDFRKDRLEEGRENLKQSLLILNIATFIGGLVLSYLLAKKTLEPIESAYESQARFTADASHELRTPLAVIRTETEVALRDKKLDIKSAKEQLKSNLEEADKLSKLTESLLLLARNGSIKAELDKLNIKSVIDQVIINYSDVSKKSNIKIKNSTKDCYVMAERSSFTQLISIILDNAIKYSEPSKLIEITNHIKDGDIEIDIKDQGPGIAKQDLPYIFDKFYRADESRTKTATEGFGLGLSLAKILASNNNASVYVKSTSNKGTTFTVKIKQA